MPKQKMIAFFLILLLITPTIPLRAGQTSDDPIENFSNGVLISSFLTMGISIYVLIFRPLEVASEKYDDSKLARRKAKANIPDMEVKEVGETENGEPQVRLQDLNNPENYVILIWTEQENNPTAVFQEGTLISFQPSAQGSGWLLRDREKTLAFVPVNAFDYTGSALFSPSPL